MDSREKLSRFFLDENERSFNFGVPKGKRRPSYAKALEGEESSLKL
jgi:hypothetical protein